MPTKATAPQLVTRAGWRLPLEQSDFESSFACPWCDMPIPFPHTLAMTKIRSWNFTSFNAEFIMLTFRQFFSSSLFGTALPLVSTVLHSTAMAKTCSHRVGRDTSMDLVSGSNLSSYLGSHRSDFWAPAHRMQSLNPQLQTAADF